MSAIARFYSKTCARLAWLCLPLLITAAMPIYSEGQAPDLRIIFYPTVTISPPSAVRGDVVTVSRTWFVQNVGDADAPTFLDGIYLSRDATITTEDIQIGTLSSPAIPKGGLYAFSESSFTLPADLSPGEYYVGIVVDCSNLVLESDESNNNLALHNTLQVLRTGDIDLVPSALPGQAILGNFSETSWDVEVAIGGNLYVSSWEVKNEGTENAPPSGVSYYVSKDELFSQDDTHLADDTIPPVAAASFVIVRPRSVQLPSNVAAARYYFLVVIDPYNTLPEKAGGQKANNCLAIPLVIMEGPPDTTPVSRLQLRLKTGNVTNAGTDDAVFAQFNETHRMWLDYGRDDFENEDDFTYEISLDDTSYDCQWNNACHNIEKLADIGNVRLDKDGGDSWCVEKVQLLASGSRIYERQFSPCVWIDPANGHGPLTLTYLELRRNVAWRNYQFPSTLPLVYPRDDLENMIEGLVGNTIHATPVYWGKLSGRAVEVKRQSDHSVSVDLDLAIHVPTWFDPALDVDFDLNITCACGTLQMSVIDFQHHIDKTLSAVLAPHVFLALELADHALADNLQRQASRLEKHIFNELCPTIMVTNAGDLRIGDDIPLRPDLVLQTQAESEPVRPGQVITLNQKVQSVGNVPVSEFATDQYLALGTSPPTDSWEHLAESALHIGSQAMKGLKECEAIQWSQQIKLPNEMQCTMFSSPQFDPQLAQELFGVPSKPSWPWSPAYYVLTRARTSYEDANPADNLSHQLLSVGLSDLLVSRLDSRSVSASGTTITVANKNQRNGGIWNRGIYPSGRFRYTFFLAPTTPPPLGTEILLGTSEVDGLEPGHFLAWPSQQFALSSGALKSGEYHFGIRVEPIAAAECDLGNNTQAVRLTYTPWGFLGDPISESYVGYTYSGGGGETRAWTFTGWNSAFTFNTNRYFGVVVDFSKHYNLRTASNTSTAFNEYNFVVGPTFAYRSTRRLTPFARVLAGMTQMGGKSDTWNNQRAFTWGFGAGLDLAIRKSLSLRILQVDYLRTRFDTDVVQSRVRLSLGIVVPLGRRTRLSE